MKLSLSTSPYLAFTGLLVGSLHAGSMWSKNVTLGERVCTKKQEACIKVTIDHDIQYAKLNLHGRVKSTKRAGNATLYLTGYRGNKPSINARIPLYINGNYSQILEAQSKKLRGVDRDTRFEIESLEF